MSSPGPSVAGPLPSATYAGAYKPYYAPRNAGGQLVGVESLNGLIGLVAIDGDTSIGVTKPGLGVIQVSTAGLPQVPSSVTATGAIVGATVTATGGLAGATLVTSAGTINALTGVTANFAGAVTCPNILPSAQIAPYVPANGGNGSTTCNFMQIGSLGFVFGYGTTGGSGFLQIELPAGRTGNPVAQSVTALGTNLAGQASIYGAYTAPAGQTTYCLAVDRTTGSSQASIQCTYVSIYVMTN